MIFFVNISVEYWKFELISIDLCVCVYIRDIQRFGFGLIFDDFVGYFVGYIVLSCIVFSFWSGCSKFFISDSEFFF